jgi:hypothetical protein
MKIAVATFLLTLSSVVSFSPRPLPTVNKPTPLAILNRSRSSVTFATTTDEDVTTTNLDVPAVEEFTEKKQGFLSRVLRRRGRNLDQTALAMDSVIAEGHNDADIDSLMAKGEEQSETQKLLAQVKEAGLAGVISYALWELGFWFVSIPIVIAGYYEVAGHWPDLSNSDDLGKLGAEA